MNTKTELVDAAERRRITTDLEETFLVEAAAGTGKTTVLVDRIVAVLAAGCATIEEIVAVTFTEKAAAELSLRLRERIESRLQVEVEVEVEAAERARLLAALRGLELAQVSTIHAFCGELLRMHPVEAGVDPRFRVLGEGEQNELRAQAFETFIQAKLDDPPPGMRRLIRWGKSRDGWVEDLRRAANDLIEHRDFASPWALPEAFDRVAEQAALWERVRELALLDPGRNPKKLPKLDIPGICQGAWTTLKARTRALGVPSLFARDPDLEESIDWAEGALAKLHEEVERKFKKWVPDDQQAIEDAAGAFLEASEAYRQRAEGELAALLRGELLPVVREYQRLSEVAGEVDMVEPLLRTRDLLRGDASVRAALQETYRYIFVDEVQDTDPLQAQILLLLSADDPAESDWLKIRPTPGKLFLVGDPKQAIYRFRRADLAFYDSLKSRVQAGGAELLSLRSSFRARPAIQRVINTSFAQYFKETPGIQPAHVPLEPVRDDIERPAVVALASSAPYGRYGPYFSNVNASAADDVPQFVDWLLHQSGWTVPDGEGGERPIRPGDIALLFRSMNSGGHDLTAPYRDSLEERGIPYALSGGRGLYERAEVVSLIQLGTALEFPDDALSVWSVLRGALFGHEDSALYLYTRLFGHPHPFRLPDVTAARVQSGLEIADEALEETLASLRAVVETLRALRDWHMRRNRRALAETFEEVLSTTRARFALAQGPGGAQVLANIERFVVEARSFESQGATSFRSFLDHLRDQRDARAGAEGAAAEADEGSVRIMTVHKSKGLEFPIVILCHPASWKSSYDPNYYSDPERELRAQKIAGCRPRDLTENLTRAKRAEHAENARLTYVAATRARELLVVPFSAHLKPNPKREPKNPHGFIPGWVFPLTRACYPGRDSRPAPVLEAPRFSADAIREQVPPDPRIVRVPPGRHGDVVWWDPNALPTQPVRQDRPEMQRLLADRGRASEGTELFEAWSARRARARHAGSRPTQRVETVTEAAQTRSVTNAPEISVLRTTGAVGERPRGARFGTLVHRVLADVAFDADEGAIGELSELHGRLVGATEEERVAAQVAVRAALAHELLREAAESEQVLREAPIMLTLDDGTLVEGTVDLAFMGADDPFGGEARWVVVDYKTDLADAASAVDDAYRVQIGLYAQALEAASGVGADAVILGV